MTSGALAAGKLVLFLALHSSSLALEKDELSLTGGQKRKRGEERLQERLAQAAALMHQVRKPEQEFLLRRQPRIYAVGPRLRSRDFRAVFLGETSVKQLTIFVRVASVT